jgi:RNA polymerase sigma-70 factor (ECF subfamily)
MENRLKLDQITKKLSEGDVNALEELFNHFYPRLYNFSRSFLKLETGIDDILQEVFIRIWQNRKNIRNEENFNAYIFTITRNLLLNELRRRLNDSKLKEQIFKRSVAEEYLLSEQLEYHELKERINLIVNELPESHREVFILSRYEGLPHKEIAQKMDISEKTVEYHIRQSIIIIKQKLRDLKFLFILYLCLFL